MRQKCVTDAPEMRHPCVAADRIGQPTEDKNLLFAIKFSEDLTGGLIAPENSLAFKVIMDYVRAQLWQAMANAALVDFLIFFGHGIFVMMRHSRSFASIEHLRCAPLVWHAARAT